MPRRHRTAEAGVALLEVIIALAVAALALAVLFQAASTGLRNVQIASRTEEAVSRANSHLAELGQTGPITPIEQSGAEGGYEYHLLVTQAAAAANIALYTVRISMAWQDSGRTRTVTLETKRLAAQRAGP